MSHTKEPWRFAWQNNNELQMSFACVVIGDNIVVIGNGAEAEANARRIVACVNACAGLTNEQLEQCVTLDRGRIQQDVDRVQLHAERDRLAAELAEIKKEAETNQKWAFLEWMQKAKDLAAELKELRQRFDKLNHECDGYMEDNKRLDAENKRLREALEKACEVIEGEYDEPFELGRSVLKGKP